MSIPEQSIVLDSSSTRSGKTRSRNAHPLTTCERCHRLLEDGEVVWLSRVLVRRGPRVCWSAAACCTPCTPSHRQSRLSVNPCVQCGRPVGHRPGSRSFCSPYCRWTKRNTSRAESRIAGRPRRACTVCGAAIVVRRSDASTCSAACRQRAYRRRVLLTERTRQI